MSRLVMCSIFDSVAGVFHRPFVVSATGVAVRDFQQQVNSDKPDNLLALHPNDFGLYRVADFDDETGAVYAEEEPRLLLRASEVLVKHPDQEGRN